MCNVCTKRVFNFTHFCNTTHILLFIVWPHSLCMCDNKIYFIIGRYKLAKATQQNRKPNKTKNTQTTKKLFFFHRAQKMCKSRQNN